LTVKVTGTFTLLTPLVAQAVGKNSFTLTATDTVVVQK
jgi:hypothetical protein